MTAHEETYLEANKKYVVQPHAEPLKWERAGGRVIVEGHGIMVKDSDGKEYVEACVPYVATSMGHGLQEIAEAARLRATDRPARPRAASGGSESR